MFPSAASMNRRTTALRHDTAATPARRMSIRAASAMWRLTTPSSSSGAMMVTSRSSRATRMLRPTLASRLRWWADNISIGSRGTGVLVGASPAEAWFRDEIHLAGRHYHSPYGIQAPGGRRIDCLIAGGRVPWLAGTESKGYASRMPDKYELYDQAVDLVADGKLAEAV